MATAIMEKMTKNGCTVIAPDAEVHLFFYDGTPMTLSYDSNKMLEPMSVMMENLHEFVKKSMPGEPTIQDIKNNCESMLRALNDQLLATKGDKITSKKMFKAWGKQYPEKLALWCQCVWTLENKCGVPSSDTFGYVGLGMNNVAFDATMEKQELLTCGNPSCDYKARYMKKCSVCKTERYCSAECQKIHWKEHKKVCGK